MTVLSRTSVAILLLAAARSLAADPSPDERTLRDAGLGTDGPALLAYLKAQIPSPSDQARLGSAVDQLGHRSFSIRERASRTLVAAGRPALPLLRPALAAADLEVSRRAERIVEEIERLSYSSLMSAVVRVLAERKPAGVVETFLAYLPFVQDDQVEELVREGLLTTGLERGLPHPAIRAALTDREPRLRAAAVFVLGRSAAPPLKELSPLLRDPQAEVRLLAAEAVLRGRDRAGVPVLLTLLDEAPLPVGRRAEEMLYHLAGDTSPSVSLGAGDEAIRRRCREVWVNWWTVRGDKVDLARFQSSAAPLGVTLHCVYDSPAGEGRVWLEGADGKPRWEIGSLSGPNDAQLLPGGRVLIAERNGGRVTERDSTGRILWERRVEAGAIAALRLPGGNTLITTWTSLLEVKPDGKAVWEYTHPAGFRSCCRGPGGKLLAVTAGGQVLELDRAGKLLRTITPERHGPGAGYWASVEAIPGGRYLVAFGSTRKVAEIDETGKVLWETDVPNAVFATRQSNGHTLVCNFEECQVIELDRAGKELSRRKLVGRPFAVRKY